jgi:ubiquinone/menaquinone biosynthesis C-methylase UbiE
MTSTIRFHSLFRRDRDFDRLARRLMSDERRSYQDPLKISKAIGVRKGMTVADMGCGSGFFTLPLATLVGPKGLVYAVESNPTMLRHLRDNIRKSGVNAKTIRVMRADVSRTRIPSACADIVLLVRILHDIENRRTFLKEVRRICKPGGRVVDLDWKKIRMKHGPPYEIMLSKSESTRILTENGFRLIRAFNPGRYHYGLIVTPLRA